MRPYILAVFTAALFALPTSAAFSQVDVEIGSGGVRVGPGYHRHLYNRSDEGRCRELRQACVHKGQLGEEGCSGPGSLNRFSASLSGVSAGVRLPCGWAAG